MGQLTPTRPLQLSQSMMTVVPATPAPAAPQVTNTWVSAGMMPFDAVAVMPVGVTLKQLIAAGAVATPGVNDP
jgi:hypothetical protein